MLPYRKENIPLAKALRRDMTPAERLLWYRFLRGYPVRFQRQKALGDFIADFYCAKARLVVELDGSQHGTPPSGGSRPGPDPDPGGNGASGGAVLERGRAPVRRGRSRRYRPYRPGADGGQIP